MAGLVVRGVTARLVWGYHDAGTLRDWTVSKTDDGWSLTAIPVSIDTCRASKRPLTFVAVHATGAWRWPVNTLEITAGAVTACLGPKEGTPNGIAVRPT